MGSEMCIRDRCSSKTIEVCAMDVPMKFEVLESSVLSDSLKTVYGCKALLVVPCYSIKGFPCRVVVVRFVLSLS